MCVITAVSQILSTGNVLEGDMKAKNGGEVIGDLTGGNVKWKYALTMNC